MLDLAIAISLYVASAAVTIGAGQYFWGAPPVDRAVVIVLAVGLAVPAGLVWVVRTDRAVGLVGAVAICVAAAVAFVALLQNSLPERPFGDRQIVLQFTNDMYPYPRWLIPISIVSWFYRGVWMFPPVQRQLGTALADAGRKPLAVPKTPAEQWRVPRGIHAGVAALCYRIR
jgi:hypothetical protein